MYPLSSYPSFMVLLWMHFQLRELALAHSTSVSGSSESTTFKKPLLGTEEQFHFFGRYVAALGSSALYEFP